MLDFLPAGGAMVLAGMALYAADRPAAAAEPRVGRAGDLARPDLTQTYQLTERLWEVRVHPDSPLVDQQLAEV